MNGALIAVVTFLISGAVCIPTGMYLRKKTAESKIKSAENEANRILTNARKEAEKVFKKVTIFLYKKYEFNQVCFCKFTCEQINVVYYCITACSTC